jgi:hypothetical protein
MEKSAFARPSRTRSATVLAGIVGALIIARSFVGGASGSHEAARHTIIGKWRPAEAADHSHGLFPTATANPVEYTDSAIIYDGGPHPVAYAPDRRSATNDGINCTMTGDDTLECTGFGGLIHSSYVRGDVQAPSVEVPR